MGLKEVSLLENGWQRLPSGLLIQWGSLSINTDTRQIVYFPISFIQYVYTVQVTSDRDVMSGTTSIIAASTVQKLNIKSMQITNDNGTSKHYWFALGY